MTNLCNGSLACFINLTPQSLEKKMKVPCAKLIPFIVTGLEYLQPALTNSQFNNLTLVATALVLGGKFNLSEISRMWLEEKCVSALSHFFSHAKFSTYEMEQL